MKTSLYLPVIKTTVSLTDRQVYKWEMQRSHQTCRKAIILCMYLVMALCVYCVCCVLCVVHVRVKDRIRTRVSCVCVVCVCVSIVCVCLVCGTCESER